MWKCDLTRAYHQLWADPLNAPLLGLKVQNDIYIDLCPPFGCRSSAAICQRVANALVFMMAQHGFSIIPQRIAYLVDECATWLTKTKANMRMIQSIAGRIIYVANAIPPARKFTARILAVLRMLPDGGWITLMDDFKTEILDFNAKLSNGIHLFKPQRETLHIECDSSMFGAGGLAPPYCYTWTYYAEHMKCFTDIHHLEAVNIRVAYQTLAASQRIAPANLIIWTDNIASSWALSMVKTEDQEGLS